MVYVTLSMLSTLSFFFSRHFRAARRFCSRRRLRLIASFFGSLCSSVDPVTSICVCIIHTTQKNVFNLVEFRDRKTQTSVNPRSRPNCRFWAVQGFHTGDYFDYLDLRNQIFYIPSSEQWQRKSRFARKDQAVKSYRCSCRHTVVDSEYTDIIPRTWY